MGKITVQPPANESPQSHSTLAEWYTSRRLQLLATSETHRWTSGRLLIEKQAPRLEKTRIPYVENDVLGFLLEGTSRAQLHATDGISLNEQVRHQAMQLVPRNSEITGRWDSGWTVAVLWLNPEFVSDLAAAVQRGDPEKTRLLPAFYFNDALLYHVGRELCSELLDGNPFGPLYANSLINTLTLYLLRHYSTAQVVRELGKGTLNAVQLRTIDEYIYMHLDHKISLADLANCIHHSVPHFERMFRATTHRPPYQYVLDIRLEKARTLLTTTNLSLAEIGLQCGFANQSHFTALFRRGYGLAPARYLRGKRE